MLILESLRSGAGVTKISRVPGLYPSGRTPKRFPQHGLNMVPQVPQKNPKPRGVTIGVHVSNPCAGLPAGAAAGHSPCRLEGS